MVQKDNGNFMVQERKFGPSTAVRGKIELSEMQKIAIVIVYQIESLVGELSKKRRRDIS